MRVAIDSNVLIYAELEPDSGKGKRAAELILRVAPDGVIAAQVLGEYLRFVQRRMPGSLAEAIRQAHLYQTLFLVPPTTPAVINRAAELALAHHLQVWDGVVCVASAQAGATVLLTEDMQDGQMIEGMRLINPFTAANDATVERILPAR